MTAILYKIKSKIQAHKVKSNNLIVALNLNTLPTQGILHAKFRSNWTTFWPDYIHLVFKFVNSKIRKFPYENLTFFLDKL